MRWPNKGFLSALPLANLTYSRLVGRKDSIDFPILNCVLLEKGTSGSHLQISLKMQKDKFGFYM